MDDHSMDTSWSGRGTTLPSVCLSWCSHCNTHSHATTVPAAAVQAIQAGQITLEDYFMADMGMHPLKVVGYEGLMGALLMVGVALPVLQVTPADEGSGLHEDTRATLCMLAGSRPLALIQVSSSSGQAAGMTHNVTGLCTQGVSCNSATPLLHHPQVQHEQSRAAVCFTPPSFLRPSCAAVPPVPCKVASVVAMLMYNIAGMLVTDELGASARTVLETTRTLFVWLVRGVAGTHGGCLGGCDYAECFGLTRSQRHEYMHTEGSGDHAVSCQ
jgi:hypothetical protein